MDIESGLRAALEHDQIRVLYQPIVALATQEIEAVEALVRWEHPTRGLLSPAEFLDVAEETGLIIPIGRLVLHEACQPGEALASGLQARHQGQRQLVRHSAACRQHRREMFAQRSKGASVDAEALILEVTEGALIADIAGAAATLKSLRSLGSQRRDRRLRHRLLVALAPSALLRRHRSRWTSPSLTAFAVAARNRRSPAPSSPSAREFCLQVVAEGVESEDQDVELSRLGCRYAQGFLYARPIGADAVEELLTAGDIWHHAVEVPDSGLERPSRRSVEPASRPL